jgi:hypothetical protein
MHERCGSSSVTTTAGSAAPPALPPLAAGEPPNHADSGRLVALRAFDAMQQPNSESLAASTHVDTCV